MNNDKTAILTEIARIRDNNKLFEIFKNNDDFDIRFSIVNLIDDDSTLYEIFSNEENPLIKSIAMKRISTDIFDYDDFNCLDDYEKITYIETHSDESLLCQVAENDKNFNVRTAAILKISDRDFLLKMANSHRDYDTRVVLYKKLNDKNPLDEITEENLSESRINLVKDLDNEKFLEDIAINDSDLEVQISALKKLNRPHFYFTFFKDAWNSNDLTKFIKTLVQNYIPTDVRDYDDFKKLDKFEKIIYIETHNDESLFHKVAENDGTLNVRIAAIHKISDRDFLFKMAYSHEDYNTRLVLYKKLNNKPLLEENLTESGINLVKDLDNEEFLEDIVTNDPDLDVKISALNKLNRPLFYFNLFKDTMMHDELMQFIRTLVLNVIPTDVRNYDDFDELNTFKKIIYIETHNDELLFHNVAENEWNFYVRMAAIHKISDRDFLFKMAKAPNEYDTRVVFYKKLNNKPLLEEITEENLTESRINLVKDLDNEKFLEDIAANDSNLEVQLSALKKVNRPHLYFDIINASNQDDLRQLIDNINDESELMDVIIFFSSDKFIVENAINNIANLPVLFELYHRGSDLIRGTVIKKLLFGNVFSNEKIVDKINIFRIVLSVCGEDVLEDIARNDYDWRVRRDAVEIIIDENVLADIARNDSNMDVRIAAVKKIDDEEVLADIARNDSRGYVRRITTEKIGDKDVLVDIARNDTDNYVRMAAVKKIDDEDILTDIARNDSDKDVRKIAAEKIDDKDIPAEIARNELDETIAGETFPDSENDEVLIDVARNNPDKDIRTAAVEKIDNQNILTDIARNDSSSAVRIAAVKKIDDKDVLADIARNDSDWAVWHIAIQRISDDNILTDIAMGDFEYPIRIEAVKCLKNEDVLIDIARNNPDDGIRGVAVTNIHDDEVLADILRNDSNWQVRENALENISDANTLKKLLLENFGYISVDSYSSFKRNYDQLIYESIGTHVYENILDKLSDESVLIDLVHERIFSDLRVLIVRRLTSPDALMDLALNDLDYRVRLEAIKNPNLCDKKTFVKALQSDHNDAVRLESLKRIDDNDLLENINNDLNPLMKLYAFERLEGDFTLNNDVAFEDIDLSSIDAIEDENVLCSIVKNAPSASIRRYALDKIKDEYILANLVCCNEEVMNMVLNKIKDNLLLLNIALYCSDPSAKRKAIKKIEDEELLLNAVQNNPYNDISAYIVDRISDESLLEIIALNNSNPYNRKAAVNKIKSQDILIRLGEIEAEEIVCTTIVRKTRDKGLLEYIGLSNPSKTVRRYVGSITDDEELLYKFALKEYEFDNRRELISKLTNEEYTINLLKRESNGNVFNADFEIMDEDLLIDLAKNSFSSYAAREYALKHIKDKSILIDFIYSSPFCSKNPKDNSVWEGIQYQYFDKRLCLSVLADLNDMSMIENFLIENELHLCGELFDLRDRITEMSSIYRIILNCKSKDVRKLFKPKLEYTTEYENDEPDDDSENRAMSGLGALFG